MSVRTVIVVRSSVKTSERWSSQNLIQSKTSGYRESAVQFLYNRPYVKLMDKPSIYPLSNQILNS